MRGLKEEFGDYGYTVPEWVQILVKQGNLKDTSWHNDAMPSFDVVNGNEDEEAGVRLWIDHKDLLQRECETPRFIIDITDIENPAYIGDDPQGINDILFKTDYDPATGKYYVRLIGADKKVAEGFDDEVFALMWIDQLFEDHSTEVGEC